MSVLMLVNRQAQVPAMSAARNMGFACILLQKKRTVVLSALSMVMRHHSGVTFSLLFGSLA